MSMSGALDARIRAAVVPRPARASGVRDSVAPNNVCVMLSISSGALVFETGAGARTLI